jgi:hypothetical protein
MFIFMRTTIVLEDQLFKTAKHWAAEMDLTLSEVINEALRQALNRPATEPPLFDMVTFGASASAIHHEPGDFVEPISLEGEPKIDGTLGR